MPFDEDHWAEVIKRPDWYFEFVELAKKAKSELAAEQLTELNKKIRNFFETALHEGEVTLADSGPNLDEQRQPIDTIVIHHTSAEPGYQLSYMNAVQLLNIYATAYASSAVRQERSLKQTAIWSGHFNNGQQIFWGYHWLLRMDGQPERLLPDKQVGWHSGNWDMNKRSIGICLDNDYEKKDPTDETLQFLASHIARYYPDVKNIIGHCEVTNTLCPGSDFLDIWKPKLLHRLTLKAAS